jgi:AcrR family transcriptional regulator
MGITERREREREALRTQILEAARDILSEQGLDALSMRAIAERIEYSPATIYLYFRDKNELIHEVVHEGFTRLHEYMAAAVESEVTPPPYTPSEYAVMGRAYARFALENTAYFRVMFELPGVAQMDCPCPEPQDGATITDKPSFGVVVQAVQRAADQGLMKVVDAHRGAVIGWGLIHGLTSLYLGGHLRETAQSHDEFMELISEAQHTLYEGWQVRENVAVATAEGGPELETAAAAPA